MEEVAKEVVGDTEMKVDMVEVEVEVVKCSNQFPQFASSAVIELCKYQLSCWLQILASMLPSIDRLRSTMLKRNTCAPKTRQKYLT